MVLLRESEQQGNNLDEYSDDSDAESENERKAKKTKKTWNDYKTIPPYSCR